MENKTKWMKYDDGKDKLIFRVGGDGSFEIKEFNGKKAPEDRNSEEYSTFTFATMGIVGKIISQLDEISMKENGVVKKNGK